MKTTAKHKLDGYDVPAVSARPLAEQHVTLDNALTRAGHGLTLSEKRIVMAAVSKLDSRKAAVFPLTTRITAAEYAETFDVDLNTAYEQLQDGATHLYQRSITFFEQAADRRRRATRRGGDDKLITVRMRWVGSVRYHKGEGWVELSWWHELIPHLVGIRKQFTTYQLKQASALRSVYSWRLLELLMRFSSTGEAEYTIEDFCTSMDAPPSLRKDFARVRTRIIEPAVLDLCKKDGWDIAWAPVRRGRKVAAIRFEFRRNPQGSLF